ncbi:MAG: hypothetical protein ACT4P1_04405 [Sporichthyaceae bacterium]
MIPSHGADPGTADPALSVPGAHADLPPWPPPPESFTTRAQLLRARAGAIPPLHDANLSLRAFAKTTLLILLAAALYGVSIVGWAESESDPEAKVLGPVGAVVWAMLTGIPAVLITWRVLRRTQHAREAGRRWRAWEDLPDTPEARALPPGDLAHDLRDLFDAQTRAVGSRHVMHGCDQLYSNPWSTRLLIRAAFTGLGLGLGGAVLAIGILGFEQGGAGFVPAGALIFSGSAIQAYKGGRRAWRAQNQHSRDFKELALWRAATGFGDLSIPDP